MKYRETTLVVNSLITFSKTSALVAIVVGCAALAGKMWNTSAIITILQHLNLTHPITAFILLLTGINIRLFYCNCRYSIFFSSVAFLLLFVGIILFFHRFTLPIHFSAATDLRIAIITILFALSMLFSRFPKAGLFSQLLALSAILVLLVLLLQTSTPVLSGITTPLPSHDILSVAIFLLLGFSILFLNTSTGIIKIITDSGTGSTIARRLLPTLIAVPFLLRWLILLGQRANLYNVETGATILTLTSILIFSTIILRDAYFLNKSDFYRKEAEEKGLETNLRLEALVEKMKEQSRKNMLLAEMKNLLQACETIEESPPIISSYMNQIFSNEHGALYLFNPSRNNLELISKWGAFPEEPEAQAIIPDECWALKKGAPHTSEHWEGLRCPHIPKSFLRGNRCIPLSAKGSTLGLLCFLTSLEMSNTDTATENKNFAIDLASQISLSLANLQLREDLKQQSIRDSLTGLFNRRYLEETLERELLRAQRKEYPIGVMMIDIDHFKDFNDTHGHSAGDTVLAQVGKFLKQSLRSSDIACRYGGEEFTLILPEANLEQTAARAEKIRIAVKSLAYPQGTKPLPGITFSIGVALFPDHGENSSAILASADRALYRAKKEGRDRVKIYTL
ncbi:MAG: sensor domain-containing diguanylate cyclase [Candidatus Ratteibacteria bacterium]|jgi:diguanylate cyclase (GGDEF)-like protein